MRNYTNLQLCQYAQREYSTAFVTRYPIFLETSLSIQRGIFFIIDRKLHVSLYQNGH